MKVTAREVLAAWVELDRQAPYHTENKPIGTDRKRVEGPAPTNESFPNSWLPTQKAEPCAEVMTVEPVAVAKISAYAPYQAWFAPDGAMHVAPTSHDAKAEEILREAGILDDSFENPTERLLSKGWVRFSGNSFEGPGKRMNEMAQWASQNSAARGIDHVFYEAREEGFGTYRLIAFTRAALTQALNSLEAKNATVRVYFFNGQKPVLMRDKQRGAMRRFADQEPIPGVPAAMFRAWEKAHDLFLDIYDQPTQPLLEQLTHYLAQFVKEVQRVGLYVKPEDISRLESYAATHPPDIRNRYSADYMSDILDELDTMIGRVHGEATRLTNTTREQWYEYEAEQMRVNEDRARHNWDNKVLKKVEPRLTQEELLDQRGEMAPFYEEMWRRKRRHELTGMRVKGENKLSHREETMKITAAEVLPFDPSKRRLKTLPHSKPSKPAPTPPTGYVAPPPGQRWDAKNLEDAWSALERGEGEFITMRDPRIDPSGRKGPMQAQPEPENWESLPEGDDYESMLMLFDSTAGGMKDIMDSFIEIQPSLPPDKQKECGVLIRKLQNALRALSA